MESLGLWFILYLILGGGKRAAPPGPAPLPPPGVLPDPPKPGPSPPPWPQPPVPPSLPPWPQGWQPMQHLTPDVVARANDLLPVLWKEGQGSRRTESASGGRLVTYLAAFTSPGVKGVTAWEPRNGIAPAPMPVPVPPPAPTPPPAPPPSPSPPEPEPHEDNA